MEPKRILVIANQTLGGTALLSEIKLRLAEGPCEFTLIVPATPPQEHATWTEGEAIDIAKRRLSAALDHFSQLDAAFSGMVGDANPLTAIGDAMLEGEYDEIIVSTLPPTLSRWLKQDLPHRVERRYKIPVTPVISSKEPTPIG
jgi:hypothetical protein